MEATMENRSYWPQEGSPVAVTPAGSGQPMSNTSDLSPTTESPDEAATMGIISIQVLLLFVIFILTVICVLLPQKIFPKDARKEVSKKSQRIMGLCNCVSGGVFLGTCYIGLIPFIEDKFAKIFNMLNVKQQYPVTQLTVMAGFFMIVLVEQCVHVWQDRKKNQEEAQELFKFPKEFLMYDSDTTISEDSDLESEFEANQIVEANAPPSARSKEVRTNGQQKSLHSGTSRPKSKVHSTSSSSAASGHHGHGHSHDSQLGHGHSHAIHLTEGRFNLRSFILILALSIHGVFEGLAVGLQDKLDKLIHLYVAVLVHELLVSFAVGVSLARQRVSLQAAIKVAIVFCLMIPVGMAFGMALGTAHSIAGQITSAIVQGIAAGTFVYVIFLEILPTEINSCDDRLLKVLFLFLGFVLVACLRIAVHD